MSSPLMESISRPPYLTAQLGNTHLDGVRIG